MWCRRRQQVNIKCIVVVGSKWNTTTLLCPWTTVTIVVGSKWNWIGRKSSLSLGFSTEFPCEEHAQIAEMIPSSFNKRLILLLRSSPEEWYLSLHRYGTYHLSTRDMVSSLAASEIGLAVSRVYLWALVLNSHVRNMHKSQKWFLQRLYYSPRKLASFLELRKDWSNGPLPFAHVTNFSI